MLQYERIDISEGVDVNKIIVSRECELCHYWYFKDIEFKFEEHVCNGCHDLLTMAYLLENSDIKRKKELLLGVFCGVLVEMKV